MASMGDGKVMEWQTDIERAARHRVHRMSQIDRRSRILRGNDALSQFFNAWVFRGDPNECISGRCWREQRLWAVRLINRLFFWQENHCKEAWERDNSWAGKRLVYLRSLARGR